MSERIFIDELTEDMPWQFKHHQSIDVLLGAVAKQMQDVYNFFCELNVKRRIEEAEGVQLDRIGDIVCLSRAQAGLLMGDPIPVDICDDETYRIYLKYKILLNTSTCTYKDLMAGLSMFFDDVIEYREDTSRPATILLKASNDVTKLLTELPVPRSAGVGVYVEEKSNEAESDIVPYIALFFDDLYVFRWTNLGSYVSGGVLFASSGQVVDGVFYPPEDSTVSGQMVTIVS